ncbi:MAG: PEP-CTERM sorting domain-containing protein [Acidobacteriaceae bacterium]|nr:PEP-CTERM sorting domain-containing protein [Acidobacteriaceae bacterium]
MVGLLAVSSSIAHATSITYNLIGVTTSAGTVTGTVAIDSTTDLITAANITFNDAAVGNPVFSQITVANAYNGLSQEYISGASNSALNWGGQIALYFNTASIGTGDLNLCLYVGSCGTESNQASFVQVYANSGLGGPFDITSGSLDPVSTGTSQSSPSAAPEPSTLFLLGTGILAVAVLTRRKFFKP